MFQKMLQGGNAKTSHTEILKSGFPYKTEFTITTGFKPSGFIYYYLNAISGACCVARVVFEDNSIYKTEVGYGGLDTKSEIGSFATQLENGVKFYSEGSSLVNTKVIVVLYK